MYKDLQKDVENGLTFEQAIIGFSPAICGSLNRKNQLVPKPELRKKLTEIKSELKRIQNLTEMDAELEHQGEYDKEIAAHEVLVLKNTALRQKYTALIEKIKNWDVMPHTETVGQIQFIAIRDLSFSMEQACYIPKASPTRYTGFEWKQNKIKALEMMVDEYAEAWKIERETVKHVLELLAREKDLQAVKNA
jgi:hypothetical protein